MLQFILQDGFLNQLQGDAVLQRRRKRVALTYDVNSARSRIPEHLDVTQDDATTPLAFRIIRIILLTAEARRAQDIHLDQVRSLAGSRRCDVAYVNICLFRSDFVVAGAV